MTPFRFDGYLDLAEDLVYRDDEAAWRSAVSRAYYGLLHVAFEALPAGLRATISYGAIHRGTWQLYDASSQQVCRRIGQAGRRLRNARVDADYRVTAALTAAHSQRLVAEARRALDLLRQHGC